MPLALTEAPVHLRCARTARLFPLKQCFAVWLAAFSLMEAPAAEGDANELTDRSLEELMKIEVKTSARKEQTLSQTAAAIEVITQEDIRRSGATTIAEALRMAPGLEVARISGNQWAVSSRGFNDFFANKLLVLNDGRSVYTPLFSGVFWDVQDTLLEDIDRIEVIRGPGAALWGANAVNGVINIISKNSKDTQGGLLSAGGGNIDADGAVRYGGKIKEIGTYRVYAKYFDRTHFLDSLGRDAADGWNVFRSGFRSDWNVSPQNNFTFQGDIYTGKAGQRVTVATLTPPLFMRQLSGESDLGGGNLLGSWKHSFSDAADLTIQGYYDRTERRDQVHHEVRNTYDLDAVQRFALGDRQEIQFGLGYRYTQDRLGEGKGNSGTITLNPDARGDQLFSTFLQDEIQIIPNRFRLTLGAKLEHNDYTGFELQPSARLLWTPNNWNSVWAAVSRAVRTPSRFEDDIVARFSVLPLPPPAGPTFIQLLGNPAFHSEKLIAYELGYRVQPARRVSFDTALFYNDYDDLRVFEGFPPSFFPQNGMTGETYGGELAVNLTVTKDWRLRAGYTLLKMQLHQRPAPGAIPAETPEGDSPQNQFHIRSFLDLPYHLEFDSAVYYVDHLSFRGVPGYVRLDLRLGWRPIPSLELSLNAQNLLDNRHPEFGAGYLVSPSEIPRSIYAKATWRF